MKASRRLAENDIITRGVTVKIQQVSVCGNYENPSNDAKGEVSSLAKGYDPLYSSSPLASLDGFSRSHDLYVMQLVVAATNQNGLYKKHMFCRKNVNNKKMRKIVRPARF
jgi:hypothetical protein